ncbi:acyl-CoA dehydrogenase family protein [Peterkaempfera bronchialis]|uniref:acyl-CoA dehydrogenase family protein n=1 Tax=Peterkaempfera bronchialis TaxID=2126346 RepID=UPI003C2ACA26
MTPHQLSGPTVAVAAALDRLPRVVDLLAARADELDRDGAFPYQGIEAVHEAGLLTLTVAERYGGPGAGLADTVRVLGELGRGDASVALVAAMTLLHHAAQARTGAWPDALYGVLLEESRRGPALVNTLRVEPELGTPGRGGLPATVARRTGQGWALTGRKTFCTGAEALAWMAVWARTDEERPRVGTFLVRGDAPGIGIDPIWDHLGMRASASHDVLLDEVLVPEQAAVGLHDAHDAHASHDAPASGDPDGPERVAAAWNDLALPALYLGVARAARDWLVGFLHRRTPANLGAPLASLPRFQTAVGEIEARLIGAEEVLTSLARRVDEGDSEAVRRSGPAKLLATRAAISAVEQALALTGNPGLSRGNPLERHHRDVLCGRVHFPQDDVILTAAGRAALERAASGAHRRLPQGGPSRVGAA